MYYDQYSQYIYQYLTNNDFAGKLVQIINLLTRVVSAIELMLPYVAIFVLSWFCFNFIRKRWLNV